MRAEGAKHRLKGEQWNLSFVQHDFCGTVQNSMASIVNEEKCFLSLSIKVDDGLSIKIIKQILYSREVTVFNQDDIVVKGTQPLNPL